MRHAPHTKWETKKVQVHRMDKVPSMQAVAQTSTFEAPYGGDYRVLAIVVPKSRHVWVGPDQDFLIDTDAGVIGGRMTSSGNLWWCESMVEVDSPERLNLQQVIDRFEQKATFVDLGIAINNIGGNPQDLPKRVTSLRSVLDASFFLADPKGGANIGRGEDCGGRGKTRGGASGLKKCDSEA